MNARVVLAGHLITEGDLGQGEIWMDWNAYLDEPDQQLAWQEQGENILVGRVAVSEVAGQNEKHLDLSNPIRQLSNVSPDALTFLRECPAVHIVLCGPSGVLARSKAARLDPLVIKS